MIRFINSIKIKSFAAFIHLHVVVHLISFGQNSIDRLYMAVELNNILCGYSIINVKDSLSGDLNLKYLEQTAFISFHVLGKDITQYQKFRYLINPQSGNFLYHDSHHEQGDMILESTQAVEGDSMVIWSGEGRNSTFIPENTILPNPQFYPYLLKDFNDDVTVEKTYQVYDLRTGEIGSRIYNRIGTEQLELANQSFRAMIFEEMNPELGMSLKLWIDKDTGMRLKIESLQRLTMYLADESVKDKIKTGNWDDILFVKTNATIKNLHNIKYMKVRMDLDTEPNSTIEDLNVPGQVFNGSVEEGEISGICEVSLLRYGGKNAPDFPFYPDPDDEIIPYLQASNTIESDDPDIVKKTMEITEGSENAWEAACRISRWVDDNIEGAIIDGSARDTFVRGSGLCAAQSNLMAAMCRAAGIPARVVWGCMYVPKDGGSFGHHAWNEVFMGDDGWIPIDVTIHETDYVDSGHIRLGVVKTIRTEIDYHEIEILEYSEGESDVNSF